MLISIKEINKLCYGKRIAVSGDTFLYRHCECIAKFLNLQCNN